MLNVSRQPSLTYPNIAIIQQNTSFNADPTHGCPLLISAITISPNNRPTNQTAAMVALGRRRCCLFCKLPQNIAQSPAPGPLTHFWLNFAANCRFCFVPVVYSNFRFASLPQICVHDIIEVCWRLVEASETYQSIRFGSCNHLSTLVQRGEGCYLTSLPVSLVEHVYFISILGAAQPINKPTPRRWRFSHRYWS